MSKNRPYRLHGRFHWGRHILLACMALLWLLPIIWLVLCSFSARKSMSAITFFPEQYSLIQYERLLFQTDAANQFPRWMLNTTIIAVFNCIISSFFVLMTAYAMSRMRFKSRKLLMNIGMILGLFPGFLSMIAIYFIMKSVGLTNSLLGLILVYSGSSGMGYLVAKGFFDTIPVALSEAAKLDGATEFDVFTRIIVPISKPIIVYTVINAFLAPWVDFIFAKIMLNSGISTDWTVAIGLYGLLDKTRFTEYFGVFCAGGVIVSIPISVLFVIMQKFYVEGITGGATKG